MARKQERPSDPVTLMQGGRMMPSDPTDQISGSPEETVRRMAYEIYEERGKEDGHALEHWLEAECRNREQPVASLTNRS
jgi:ABC-type glutathione transport system ATPase component